MIANAPGTVNDIVSEHYRALAFSIWSIGPMVRFFLITKVLSFKLYRS